MQEVVYRNSFKFLLKEMCSVYTDLRRFLRQIFISTPYESDAHLYFHLTNHTRNTCILQKSTTT